MKVYYDDKYIEINKNNKYFIYSPLNDKYIEINEKSKNLIDYIYNSNGNISINEIRNYFISKYNLDVCNDEINKFINKLIEVKILFASNNDMQIEKLNHIGYLKKLKQGNLKVAYIHATLRCNFNCSYCYNRTLINKDYKEFSTSEWIKILKKLKKQGVVKFIFTGGEPLIRKDLKELILSVKDKNTYIEVLTNGSLLKDQFYDLIDIVDKFTVSLDSFDININSKNRSDVNYYDIISTLKLFSEYNKDKILVRSVVNKNNIDDVEHFSKQLYEEYGIESTHGWFIPNNYSEIPLVPKYRKLENPSSIRPKNVNFISILNKLACGAATSIIALDPAGNIYPCQNLMTKELKISNILNENWYEELINSDITKLLSNLSVDDIEKCKDCSYRHICGGGCRAIAYKVYGSLTDHISYFCDFLQADAKDAIEKTKISCG